jgi:hypothetical protein
LVKDGLDSVNIDLNEIKRESIKSRLGYYKPTNVAESDAYINLSLYFCSINEKTDFYEVLIYQLFERLNFDNNFSFDRFVENNIDLNVPPSIYAGAIIEISKSSKTKNSIKEPLKIIETILLKYTFYSPDKFRSNWLEIKKTYSILKMEEIYLGDLNQFYRNKIFLKNRETLASLIVITEDGQSWAIDYIMFEILSNISDFSSLFQSMENWTNSQINEFHHFLYLYEILHSKHEVIYYFEFFKPINEKGQERMLSENQNSRMIIFEATDQKLTEIILSAMKIHDDLMGLKLINNRYLIKTIDKNNENSFNRFFAKLIQVVTSNNENTKVLNISKSGNNALILDSNDKPLIMINAIQPFLEFNINNRYVRL